MYAFMPLVKLHCKFLLTVDYVCILKNGFYTSPNRPHVLPLCLIFLVPLQNIRIVV